MADRWGAQWRGGVGRHLEYLRAQRSGSAGRVALPLDVVHLVAMGVWLGGLVALCGVLLRSNDVPAMRTAVPSFSRAALVCVALLVVTGGYQG